MQQKEKYIIYHKLYSGWSSIIENCIRPCKIEGRFRFQFFFMFVCTSVKQITGWGKTQITPVHFFFEFLVNVWVCFCLHPNELYKKAEPNRISIFKVSHFSHNKAVNWKLIKHKQWLKGQSWNQNRSPKVGTMLENCSKSIWERVCLKHNRTKSTWVVISGPLAWFYFLVLFHAKPFNQKCFDLNKSIMIAVPY